MLKHITAEVCPICGSQKYFEEIERTFSGDIQVSAISGEQYETRRFICGQAISWMPHDHRKEVLSDIYVCKNTPSLKTWKTQVEAYYKLLIDLADTQQKLGNLPPNFHEYHLRDLDTLFEKYLTTLRFF
jgi:hypothetical protein